MDFQPEPFGALAKGQEFRLRQTAHCVYSFPRIG
jgi:hypothetical protein